MTQSAPATTPHVVLGDHDGVARVDQPVQLTVQQIDVGGMQTGGRLVEDVEGVPAAGRCNSEASLIRWASPPDSSVAGWPRRR